MQWLPPQPYVLGCRISSSLVDAGRYEFDKSPKPGLAGTRLAQLQALLGSNAAVRCAQCKDTAMIKHKLVLLAAVGALLAGWINIAGATEGRVLTWVGCGISKKGFMEDLAAAYEKKTGVKIVIDGGGATKGLRQVSAKQSDLGGSC